MTDPEKTQFYDEALATSVQDTFSELFRDKENNEDDAEKGDKDEDAEASLFAAEAET